MRGSDLGAQARDERVDFTYPTEPSKQVLHDLSFTVKPGQKVAFVGSTGCGKSTSIRLIERFYATLAPGTIFVDGVAIEDYDVQYLRQHTSVVAQETVLFSTTIRENIIYGVREEEKAAVTDEMIIAACKKAAAWSFIKEFPAQLETYVGDSYFHVTRAGVEVPWGTGEGQIECVDRFTNV